MRVIVMNHLSLDGVLQAPARSDEDERGGFRHGGWAVGEVEPEMSAAMGERMGSGFSWLFGRRSYDDMLSHWNAKGGPFRDGLNAVTKYVATSRPHPDLPWPNSVPLVGDVPARVAELRDRPGPPLVIMGSGELIRSLLPRGLVDELLLFLHPVVLGSGTRMFADVDDVHRFRLRSAATTASGIIVADYALARPAD